MCTWFSRLWGLLQGCKVTGGYNSPWYFIPSMPWFSLGNLGHLGCLYKTVGATSAPGPFALGLVRLLGVPVASLVQVPSVSYEASLHMPQHPLSSSVRRRSTAKWHCIQHNPPACRVIWDCLWLFNHPCQDSPFCAAAQFAHSSWKHTTSLFSVKISKLLNFGMLILKYKRRYRTSHLKKCKPQPVMEISKSLGSCIPSGTWPFAWERLPSDLVFHQLFPAAQMKANSHRLPQGFCQRKAILFQSNPPAMVRRDLVESLGWEISSLNN